MAEISKIIAGDVTYHLRDRNYCTCSTGAGTKAKTASLEGFVLTTGSVVNVRFANSNTASDPTLNINDTGAYDIKRYGTTATGTAVASSWQAGSVVTLIFDGTYWMIGHGYDANTTYSAMTASEATTGTSTTGRLIGAKVLHDKINSLVPDPMTAEEATAGTSTTTRTISAKILQDKIEEMKQTNAEMGQGYGISGNSIVTGSNLLPYPYAETTKTINGITFTDNGDGSITINGTATGQAWFKFCESFNSSSGSSYDVAFLDENNQIVSFHNYNTTLAVNTSEQSYATTDGYMTGLPFEPNEIISSIMIVIATEDSFDNLTLYPIITFYDSSHLQSFNWEPYTQSLIVSLPYYEITEGGIISVKMNTDVPAGCYLKVLYTEKGFPIKYKGSAITANVISNGDTATFMYSNEAYHLIALDSGGSGSYTLPTASADTLGGVKVGTNLSISDGVLSATDTTYESKAAASGGTDVSLVTTGQKYKWNMNNYCTCSTSSSSSAKTASLTGFTLSTGSIVHVKFSNTNSASSPSLNINSTGAYYIKRYGTTASMGSSANSWYAGAVVTFIFDGSYWMMVDYQPPLSMGSGLYVSNSTIYHDSSVSSQSTQAVYPITINSSGHITGYGSAQTILTASDVNDLIETYLSNNYGNGDEDTYGNGTSN